MEKQKLTIKENIIKYSLISLSSLILLFLIMFLFFPKLSTSTIKYGSYGTVTGFDSTLKKADLKIVKKESFKDLKVGKIIIFDLKDENNPNNNGLKVYRVMAKYDDYIHVNSTGSPTSFPWEVKEEMYRGTVVSKIPVIGIVVGFLKSWLGLGVIAINAAVITTVVIVYKTDPKKEKEKAELNEENKK